MWFKKKPTRPSAEDSALRLIVLKQVVGIAFSTPPREFLQSVTDNWSAKEIAKFEKEAKERRDQLVAGLRKSGLWRHFSTKERLLAESTLVTMSHQQQISASWRMEAVQTLMWALGMIQSLPPYDTSANTDLLKQIPSSDVAAFVASAELREPSTIDRAREIAEFWHWRSRTRQLIERGDPFPADEKMRKLGLHTYDDIVKMSARQGAQNGTIPPCVNEDFPAKGKAYRDLTADEWSEVSSITIERHFTLNWICGYAPNNNWDETPTDT